MLCELCGKESELFRAKIEETELTVCKLCSKYGEVIGSVRVNPSGKSRAETARKLEHAKSHKPSQPEEFVVENYPSILKNKREQLKLNQEDFAKLITEKVSLVHKLEIGEVEVPIELAKKLEKALHIKLVEMFQDIDVKSQHQKREGFTIGDLLTLKQDKK